MSEEKKSGIIEHIALEQVPADQRKSWVSIALIWAGAIICVPSLMVGGAIVTGMPLGLGILAGITGYIIVVLFMTFQGMQGVDLGRPTVVNAESAFGTRGAGFVISFILGVSVMGWFGVQTSVTGASFSGFLGQMGVTFPVWLSSAIWGVIMLTTAILGYKALSYLNYIAVPALILLAVYGTVIALKKFGVEGLASHAPAASMTFFQGVAVSIGAFAVGGVIAGDYSRYARNRKGAVLSSVFGVIPLGSALLIAGAIMSVVAGTYDITQVVSSLGFPVIGFIILILATWTTNTVNAYSGGLALTNMFRLPGEKRALATAVAGGIGTLLAIFGIINHFISFLSILTAGITPIAGVMIADYWIRKKGKAEAWAPYPGVNWSGIIAWVAGTLVGLFVKWGSQALNAIVVAGVLFLLLSPVLSKKEAARNIA
ncbi:MAG: cytosine permease [Spirochaetales bacterium]|nr:cytosine permease [Spirochaetales bacterium]